MTFQFQSRQRGVAIGVGVFVALKLAVLFVFAWNTRFVMDEFAQLGWAKYLGNGLFDTVWHAKAVGYVLFYKLAHLIGWDATSILLIGRMQTALLACGTLALTYASARALGNDRLRSLVMVLVLLSFSNFIERSFRTIAEPPAVFFAVAALLVMLRGGADQVRTLVIAGCLAGLSFLTTQKAIYFDVALGVALVADAALSRRYRDGILRGLWLVLGWCIPIIAYCLVFGGANALAIAQNLFLGPIEVATTGGDVYANLRTYVWQTLRLNMLLYIFCFAGIGLAWMRIARLEEGKRIALIFTSIVALLVFVHNQPWPYVFLMALPFMALWSLEPFDRLADDRRVFGLALLLLGVGIAVSFVRNIRYLEVDNASQLQLVARAEALLGPDDVYFDATGMLPNRMEPSTLWLDRAHVLKTLQQKQDSEAYRILERAPPKIILWSYRMDAIQPVIAPLIQRSYVKVAPNILMAGQHLRRGVPTAFNVPVAGSSRLYDRRGRLIEGKVSVNGALLDPPLMLPAGNAQLLLQSGAPDALLVPAGDYAGLFVEGPDDRTLFAGVYD